MIFTYLLPLAKAICCTKVRNYQNNLPLQSENKSKTPQMLYLYTIEKWSETLIRGENVGLIK